MGIKIYFVSHKEVEDFRINKQQNVLISKINFIIFIESKFLNDYKSRVIL